MLKLCSIMKNVCLKSGCIEPRIEIIQAYKKSVIVLLDIIEVEDSIKEIQECKFSLQEISSSKKS